MSYKTKEKKNKMNKCGDLTEFWTSALDIKIFKKLKEKHRKTKSNIEERNDTRTKNK